MNSAIVENKSFYYYGGVNFNYTGILYNTVVYYNTASGGCPETGGNRGMAINCCIPTTNGLELIEACKTNAPDFVDRAGFDYRLLATSPCRNAGSDALAAGLYDLDGRYRIMEQHVDIGCYEYGFVTDALDPPSITTPVSVPSGGSGVHRNTNQTTFAIAGVKQPDQLTGTPSRTNGVVQATGTGQTAWTHPGLTLTPTAGGTTGTYTYASATPDLSTYSSNRTTLSVIAVRVPAVVEITNENSWVTYDVTETGIGGTNNAWTVGTMSWSNSKGGGGTFAASPSWSVTGIVLGVDENVITVQGTNALGDVAEDSVTVLRWGEGSGEPEIKITNAPAWTYHDENSARVRGTNLNIVGKLWWVNDRSPGTTNAFNPGFNVQVNNLDFGDNLITIAGTNLFGTLASDSVTIHRQTAQERVAATNYVWRDNPNVPEPPYGSWTEAATSIHHAVAAAVTGTPTGTVILVTNGVYRQTEPVKLEDCLYVKSVNGPDVTILDGGYPQATTRCFTVKHSLAVVEGFTIRNAYWSPNGGGAFVGTAGGTFRDCRFTDCTAGEKGGGIYLNGAGNVENCRFLRCAAAKRGGGVHLEQGGAVYNSVLTRCTTSQRGGGASVYGGGRLYSCLFTNNTANRGGGVYAHYYPSRLDHCTIASNTATTAGGGLDIREGAKMCGSIVWGNAAPADENWDKTGSVTVQDSCTCPKLGSNCTTNDPCFENPAAGNYRLFCMSPCIDAGSTSPWMAGATDLDGAPRVRGPAVDCGCYESDPTEDWDGDGMWNGWERWYGLNPTNPADQYAHGDTDGFNNKDEFTADTNPNDSNSYFHVTGMSASSPVQIEFLSSSNRVYTLYACDDLVNGAWSNVPGQVRREGAGGPDAMTDTNPPPGGFRSYRLGVDLP